MSVHLGRRDELGFDALSPTQLRRIRYNQLVLIAFGTETEQQIQQAAGDGAGNADQ
jgi:hypothetical protein